MKTWTRYLLLQIPGWVVAGLVALLIQRWFQLPDWTTPTALGIWIAKDLVLYPFLKEAYDGSTSRTPATRLVDEMGTAQQDLNPQGFVRVHGELWRAMVIGSSRIVRRGERVSIRRVERMLLLIEPVEDPKDVND